MSKRLSDQEISELANRDSSEESGNDFSSTDEDELYGQPDTSSSDSLFSEREHPGFHSNAQAGQQPDTLQCQSSSSVHRTQNVCNTEPEPSSVGNEYLVGENYENEWLDIPTEIPNFPFLGAEPGVKVATTKNTGPSVYADLFFNEEFLQNLVRETNRYASQVLSTRRLQSSSRLKSWRETNIAEMK